MRRDRSTARVASGVPQKTYVAKCVCGGGGSEGRFLIFSGMYDFVRLFSTPPLHERKY